MKSGMKKISRRILSLLLSLLLVLSLAACVTEPADDSQTSEETTTAAVTRDIPTEITIHFHYLREDGDYTGWTTWLWAEADGSSYSFTEEVDEHGVAFTATFPAGTESVGYIVRLGEWEAKDIEDDQFIDLSPIYAGSVEVYVTSGVKGAEIVFGDDCVTDAEGSRDEIVATTEPVASSKSDRNWVDVEYVYDQEDNIIEDNYRNYYEIFVRSFYDSDGDGYGDLQGVIEKLDYIEEMGFNGIWLMPVMPSPSYHKYDVTDYCDIDSQYGTIEDFKELIEAAHERGIRVIIDMVMNHSSSQHEWFTTACSYLATLGENEEPDLTECPYVDYYHFSRKQETSAWHVVNGTNNGWYYEAQFDYGMPDLNLSSEAVRAEFEAISDFWIDLGVDGYRMDAALHYEENDPSYNAEVLNWLYTYCCSQNPDFYMVSEVWDGQSVINSFYASETPSMFNFPVSGAEGILVKAGKGKSKVSEFTSKMVSLQETLASVYEDAIDAPFISNHDQVRVANMLNNNENALKMTAGLLLTMNGSPFVYYGEEIGMCSSGTSDPNKRLPMVWSKTDSTGITNVPTGASTDVVSNFAGVDEQLADEGSILNYYKRALQLRNENPEIARGTVETVAGISGYQAAVTKTWNESTIGLVYNNDTENAAVIDLTGTVLEGMAIRGYLTVDGSAVTLEGNLLTLPAQSIVVLK